MGFGKKLPQHCISAAGEHPLLPGLLAGGGTAETPPSLGSLRKHSGSQPQEGWIGGALRRHPHPGVFNRVKFLITEECDKVGFTQLSKTSNILSD